MLAKAHRRDFTCLEIISFLLFQVYNHIEGFEPYCLHGCIRKRWSTSESAIEEKRRSYVARDALVKAIQTTGLLLTISIREQIFIHSDPTAPKRPQSGTAQARTKHSRTPCSQAHAFHKWRMFIKQQQDIPDPSSERRAVIFPVPPSSFHTACCIFPCSCCQTEFPASVQFLSQKYAAFREKILVFLAI